MNRRRAIATVCAGVGLMVGVLTTGAVAAVGLVALGLPDEGRAGDTPSATETTPQDTVTLETTATDPATSTTSNTPAAPRTLVVALAPGDPVLQAGVLRGRDVVLARGLEVELVRAVADRLRVDRLRFVATAGHPRLLSGAGGAWQLAVASIRPPRVAVPTVALSAPYLPTDQVVLLRRGTSRPRALADLRTRVLCAIRDTDGLRVARAIGPSAQPLVARGPVRLVQLVQTGACDAAIVDPVGASRLVEGKQALVGPFAARIRFGDGFVLAVRPDAGPDVRAVNRAIGRLRGDGTMRRITRFWLGFDFLGLPVLR